MATYTPDRWVIIKIENVEHGSHFRVFAGWYGGYTSGDSWKMSSGIEKSIEFEDYYDIYNTSGSIYKCYKNESVKGMSAYMSSVFSSYEKQAKIDGVLFNIIDEIPFLEKSL